MERLENAGVLNELRARIRAELLSTMEGKVTPSLVIVARVKLRADLQESKPPPLCNENLLINELIREYLLFNRYHCSSAVLQAG